MITAEQIPDEVVEAVERVLSRYLVGGYTLDHKESIAGIITAAALNAWETPMHRAIVGKALDEVGSMYSALILPLPKEPRT